MSFKVDFMFYTNFGYSKDLKSNVAYYTVKAAESRGLVNRIIPIGCTDTRGLSKKYFVNGIPGGNFTSRFLYLVNMVNKGFKARKTIESLLDWYGRRYLSGDILYAWPRLLNSIRKAKEKKMLTVVYCTTAHPAKILELAALESKKYYLKQKNIFDVDIDKHIKSIEESKYLFVISNSAQRTYLERGIDEDKIVTITGTGVDLSRFKFSNNKNHETFNVLFVGDITPLKGVIYLLEAWSKLRLKNSKLYIVGSISNAVKPIIKEYTRADASIILVGSVTNPEKYYRMSDLFVMPSLIEGGFGGKVTLEAMASGLPAIVTDGAGGTDIIEDGRNGFIVPIRDARSIKERIQYFYDNPSELKRMGRNARKSAENYTWDKYSERIADALEKVYEASK